jgi:predicted nucleic acid-binding protein
MTAWFSGLGTDFADRILPLTREVGRHAAAIIDRQVAQGLAPEWPDVVIAATAEFHGMTLLTRNVRHFAAAETAIVNPFSHLPE